MAEITHTLTKSAREDLSLSSSVATLRNANNALVTYGMGILFSLLSVDNVSICFTLKIYMGYTIIHGVMKPCFLGTPIVLGVCRYLHQFVIALRVSLFTFVDEC